MEVKWTTNLSVGVEKIDEQHKIWFDKANNLFQAGKNRKSKEVIDEMLRFLDEYTKEHFRDEEEYMASIRYPGLEEQRAAHANFIKELAKLKYEYEESGGNVAVIINANILIINWLTQHISNMDKQIGVFARSL